MYMEQMEAQLKREAGNMIGRKWGSWTPDDDPDGEEVIEESVEESARAFVLTENGRPLAQGGHVAYQNSSAY